MKITNLPSSVKVLSVVLALAGFMTVAQAQLINIAGDGAPIMGLNNLYTSGNNDGGPIPNYSTNGIEHTQSGNWAPINDGDLTTYTEDEYDGYDPNMDQYEFINHHFDSSYVGVVGPGILNADSTATQIHHAVTAVTLVLDLDTSGVGGWFGPNIGGGFNSPLDAAHLIAPEVQITTDGVNWTTIGSTSNYISLMTGVNPAAGGNSPLITFTLDTPTSNFEGIRLIGLDEGRGNGQGYISVTELGVLAGEVPEPSTYAMMLAGVGALFVMQRMRGKMSV